MNDWGGYGRAYEKIAIALAQRPEINSVTCILPPVKLKNGFKFADIQIHSKKLTVITPYLQSINENCKGYRLRKWINKIPGLLLLRYYFFTKGCRKVNTILWIYPPHTFIYDLIKHISYRQLVVQIVDNNSFMGGDKPGNKSAEIQYNNLVNQADCTITSSVVNYDIFSKINHNCCLIENGVGDEFISKPSDFSYKIKDIQPRLGYLGWISERTDIELLRHIALTRPDYQLVIAGPDLDNLLSSSKITGFPNVEYIGEISPKQAPDFLRSLDVCLMPHKDNAYSRSMSPLKLFQYLASGRPIVTTSVAGTEKWADFIMIADSYDAFVKDVDITLGVDDLEKSLARIEAVKTQNWDSKISLMIENLHLN